MLWENRQAFYHWQNSAEYKHTHKHRGTSKGADVKIINRELSYNIRIELADMLLARDINPQSFESP